MERKLQRLSGGVATLAGVLVFAAVGSADQQSPSSERALLNHDNVRVASVAQKDSLPIDGVRALLNRSGERDVRLVPDARIKVASRTAEPVDGKRALLGIPAAVAVQPTGSLQR
jgi:hypothetical protein